MKHHSKSTRNRLLKLASFLDGRAAAIRRYVAKKTPRRGSRQPKVAA